MAVASSPKRRSPPGRAFNAVNQFVQYPVVGHVLEGVHWALLCLLAGLLSPLVLAYKLLRAAKAASRGSDEPPKSVRASLGIFISGCDTGFGQAAAVMLFEKGYTVFAGCLTDVGQDALRQLTHGDERMVPVPLDVTKDESVTQAAVYIDSWIASATVSSPRALLATVCNAGVATGGCIDWLSVESFQRDHAVNFYGVIRTTKALLPALKRTAALRRAASPAPDGSIWPPAPRFVINSSIAGKIPVAYLSPYSTSKHASDTYAACLRMELSNWGIGVTTVLASFHKTPMVTEGITILENTWARTPEIKQREYGQRYYELMHQSTDSLLTDFAWEPVRVVEAIARASTCLSHPEAEVYCGCDSRYVMQVRGHLCFSFPFELTDVMQVRGHVCFFSF
jgi:NAD(P)-dependent dehydrogenase (short-subunit alcohol dehydrogenase family)